MFTTLLIALTLVVVAGLIVHGLVVLAYARSPRFTVDSRLARYAKR